MMKAFAATGLIGLLALAILATGCDQLQFELGGNEVESNTSEFAVLSMGPIENWYPDMMAILMNRDKPMSQEAMKKKLFGVDLKRPAAALVYVGRESLPEPVLYVPVTDYKHFQYFLKKEFDLRMAGVSSFKIAGYKIMVRQHGDYAVLGTSLYGVRNCPPFPTKYISEIPEGHDFALKVHTDDIHSSEKKNIARVVTKTLGQEFANFVTENVTFDMAMKVKAASDLGLQVQVSPTPENSNEIEKSLNQLLTENGLNSKSEAKSDSLVFNITMPSNQIQNSWNQLKPGLAKAFDMHLRVFAHQATSYTREVKQQVGGTSHGIPDTRTGGNSGKSGQSGSS